MIMLEVYAVKQPEKIDDLKYQKMLSLTSELTRSRNKRFVKWQDAQRELVADILARSIIRKKLNLNNEEIIFERSKDGKPGLSGHPDFHFNLSHAGAWVICAISDDEVGVDVEEIKPVDFDISRNYFSKEEHDALMSKEGKERLAYFYDLWTLKESYLKAVGKGLLAPLNSFSIEIKPDGIYLKNDAKNPIYYFRQYQIDGEYKLSVCVAGEIKEEKLIIQTLDEVLL